MSDIKDSSIFIDFKDKVNDLDSDLRSLESSKVGWFNKDFISDASFDEFCINCYKFSVNGSTIIDMINKNLVRLAKEGKLPCSDDSSKIRKDIHDLNELINTFSSNSDLVPNGLLPYLNYSLLYKNLELVSNRNKNK